MRLPLHSLAAAGRLVSRFAFVLGVVGVVAGAKPARARGAVGGDAGGDVHGTLASGGGIPEAAAVFSQRIHAYRFTIDPAELARLDAHPAAFDDQRRYVRAAVSIDGEDVGPVGLRYKGAWGTFRTCLGNPDGSGTAEPYQPAPAAACPPVPKFSYKIAFDGVVPGKRYHGLARINLHNLIRDPSKLHEVLAYELFRSMGIATARSTFAQVTVNGVAKGLYALTEEIGDRRFIVDHWPGGAKGLLYKQGWPRQVDAGYWQRALASPGHRRSGAGRPGSHGRMIAFARAMVAAKGNPQREAAALARFSDPDWLARYMAVDTAIRNVDGITKLFCRPGAPDDCFPNNYFWYEARDHKFLLVPWDLDYTFRVSVRQNRLPPWDRALPVPGVAGCNARITIDGALHQPAACDPLLRGINATRPLYVAAVAKLLATPDFTPPILLTKVDFWSALIKDAVAADKSIPTSGPKAWPAQVALLRQDIGILRARMEAVAAGGEYRPFPPTGAWEYPPAAPTLSPGH
jgi:spore coat protein CotH